MQKLPKLIVILAPTASGKTRLAIKLASKFNGEIISADSRQVYKYMKIGTDAPEGEGKDYLVQGIPHHLMNYVEPDQEFTLANFKKQAVNIAQDIISRNKIPFLVGGTGLYISAIVDNLDIPKVKPDRKLRKELEQKNLKELVELLKREDSQSAEAIDLQNSRRVIRALEVVLITGKSFLKQKTKSKPLFNILQIGIKRPRQELYKRINKRVDEQIKEGLIDEVKDLINRGYSWGLPSMSSLGYRQFKDYLENKQSLGDAIEILKRDIRHYAKKQISWFKRDERIVWVGGGDTEGVKRLIREFLT